MSGALLVCGATSGAGKSTVTSALCRIWSDAGRDVAPFKAQNMSNHAAVTADGGEIGRAQAMQAMAARVAPDRRMNPILLKPSAAQTSHLVVLGEEVSVTDAAGYGEVAHGLRDVVLDAFTSLRKEHDWVVAEGAGGAAEINLLDRDLVNLPLAAAANMPAIVVVDIDRGGAFASAYGTWALLPDRLRPQVRGFVFNQFRGDPSLLEPGHAELTDRTGVPVLGVLPHLGHHPMLGLEDSLDLGATTRPASSPSPVRVAVVRLPHLANPSDFDPLVMEPSVGLRQTGSGFEIRWGRPVTGEPWDAAFEGSRRGSVHGTSVHGLFDDGAFRHSFLGEVARSRGRRYEPSPVPFHAAVDAHLDHLATWLGEHLDLDAVNEIAASALPAPAAPGWVR